MATFPFSTDMNMFACPQHKGLLGCQPKESININAILILVNDSKYELSRS